MPKGNTLGGEPLAELAHSSPTLCFRGFVGTGLALSQLRGGSETGLLLMSRATYYAPLLKYPPRLRSPQPIAGDDRALVARLGT